MNWSFTCNPSLFAQSITPKIRPRKWTWNPKITYIIEQEIHLNQTSTILGVHLNFPGYRSYSSTASPLWRFPPKRMPRRDCARPALPRFYPDRSSVSIISVAHSGSLFLKLLRNSRLLVALPSHNHYKGQDCLLGGGHFAMILDVIGGRVTLNHQLWLPGNRQLTLDLLKVIFYILPWDSSTSNHHLGNMLFFSNHRTSKSELGGIQFESWTNPP